MGSGFKEEIGSPSSFQSHSALVHLSHKHGLSPSYEQTSREVLRAQCQQEGQAWPTQEWTRVHTRVHTHTLTLTLNIKTYKRERRSAQRPAWMALSLPTGTLGGSEGLLTRAPHSPPRLPHSGPWRVCSAPQTLDTGASGPGKPSVSSVSVTHLENQCCFWL